MDAPLAAPEQDGLFTRRQLLADGWGSGDVDRALVAQELVSLRRGVYATAADWETRTPLRRHQALVRAAHLELGDGWCAARRSAAVLHGLPLLGRAPRTALMTRDRRSPKERSSSRFRTIAALPAAERTDVHGIPACTMARTVYDLSRTESLRSAVVVADGALRAGLDRAELQEVVQRHRGWPGSRQAALVAAFADGRAETPIESLGRTLCLEEGLPVFQPQVELRLRGVVLARLDGLWREHLLAFEADGAVKFDGPGVLPALWGREDVLRDAGLDVVRASWSDLYGRRQTWLRRVALRLDVPRRLAPGYELCSTEVQVTSPGDIAYRWAA